MDSVGAYEAKTNLPRLLDRVEEGEEIVITRHGVAVAKLIPVRGGRRRDVSEVVGEIMEFRRGRTLDGLTIREMIEEGRA